MRAKFLLHESLRIEDFCSGKKWRHLWHFRRTCHIRYLNLMVHGKLGQLWQYIKCTENISLVVSKTIWPRNYKFKVVFRTNSNTKLLFGPCLQRSTGFQQNTKFRLFLRPSTAITYIVTLIPTLNFVLSLITVVA